MTYTIEQIKEVLEIANPHDVCSRVIIPELVAEVESLQKQLKEARAVIEKYSENRMTIEMSPLNQTIDTTLDAREWLNKWGEK